MASLEMGKGSDREQIAKVKDTCGGNMANHIPHIWYMILTMKGKANDTYPNCLKKSIESWCCTWHIKQDKSIYLTAKFFDNLVAMGFNPGGPMAQYNSVARGISMLVCQLLTAVKAEYQQGYEEATEQKKTTQCLEDLLKDKGTVITHAPDYIQLQLIIGTFCALQWSIFGK
jgi:hypothetical protein